MIRLEFVLNYSLHAKYIKFENQFFIYGFSTTNGMTYTTNGVTMTLAAPYIPSVAPLFV